MKAVDLAFLLVVEGVPVTIKMDKESKEIRYYPESGFYKSDGCAYFCDFNGEVWVFSRYGEIDCLLGLNDLIKVSYRWWRRSKDRDEMWANPSNESWARMYERIGQ